MNSISFNRLCRALVLLAALLEFSANTNAQQSFNSAPAAVPHRDSVIFIQVDGLGYGDLSCYGQTNFQTPNLDKIAAGGVRFTNYSLGYVASPSQVALMFGKTPTHADIPFGSDAITVAQILKNSGYHTGLIGGWNLGDENSGG